MSSWIRSALAFFLLFPFLFLLWQFQGGFVFDADEFLWAAGNSFWQAFGSAIFSLVLGLWMGCGLLSLPRDPRRPWRAGLEFLLLVPNFLPAVFTLLAVLNLVDPFPTGRIGIVLVHTAMNAGLCAVLVAGLLEDKIGALAEIAWVEGSSSWRFMTKVAVPLLRKDLFMLGLFVFTVCFGSFAVPLVVGGGRGTTLEVLIYEKIRLSNDWSQAVTIAVLQSAFLFSISWLTVKNRLSSVKRHGGNLSLCQSRSGAAVAVLFVVFLIFGYFQGLPSGWEQVSTLLELREELFKSFLGTLWMGFATGALCCVLLLAGALAVPCNWFEKFMSSYSAPSQALASFAFLVLTPNEGYWPYVKIPVALTLVTLPMLWRMGWQGSLESLKRQREVAETLGADSILIWKDVIRPQLMSRLGTLGGLAAVWACGDFAMSRILAHRDLTLAMMTETLMSSYRLGLATVLSLLLFVTGVICFAMVKGWAYVLGRKSAT